MKKLLLLLGMAASAAALPAQTEYDITPLMKSDLNGTARFVGMGGAMSALGGDISTISTNPAGIGIFRSNDLSMTLSYNMADSKSVFGNSTSKESRNRLSFDQIGFVYSNKIGNNTSLRFVNFGFNYHKYANYNRLFTMQGSLDGTTSQTGYMAYQVAQGGATYNSFSNMLSASDRSAFQNENFGWLGVMGGRTGLVDAAQETKDGVTTDYFYGWNGDYASYRCQTKGGTSVYDFNVAFNVEDRFYFGATIGAYDVNYSRYSVYGEDLLRQDGDDELTASYSLQHWYKTSGSGVDLKLGAIIRPFDDSSFRFGLAIHTPTWYSLTERYSTLLTSQYEMINGESIDTYQASIDSYDGWDGDVENDYELTTPWKFNVSMGGTIGTNIALGAEYEYQDYSSARLKTPDGYEDDYMATQNSYIREDLKGVHTLRLGGEFKLDPQFSFRVGYNYSSALYNKTAYKELGLYTTRTDTQFFNDYEQNTLTFGVGYRSSSFYADMAYLYSNQHADFYSYDDASLSPIGVTNETNRLMFTLGFRF